MFDATRGGEIDDRPRPRRDLPHQRRRELARGRRLDAREAPQRVQHAADHGLIRVSMPVPADAEFELDRGRRSVPPLEAADLSMFRRPLPTTNLKFLSTVMWDGRETFAARRSTSTCRDQANGATQGHAQGDPLTDAQRESIVALRGRDCTPRRSRTTSAAIPRPRRRQGRPGCDRRAVVPHRHQRQLRRLHRCRQHRLPRHRGAARQRHPRCRLQPERVHDLRRVGGLDEESARCHRSRPGAVQHAHVQHLGRLGHQRRGRIRQPRVRRRHLHDLPRRAQRGRPLGRGAARHRPRRRGDAHAGHAALHVPQQDDRRDPPRHRPRPRDDHRQVEAHRPVQGADPPLASRHARRTSTTAWRRTSARSSTSTTPGST